MNSAESMGQFIGLGISVFLPLVAIILNGISIRRRSTNTMAAAAIIVTCIALILLTFSGMGMQTTHVPFRIVQTLSITGLGLMVISTVLAIIGVVQCFRRRRYTRGKRRAGIALVLNAIFLTLFVIHTIEGVNEGVALHKLLQLPTPAGSEVKNEAWNFRIQPPAEWNAITPSAFGPDVLAALGRNHPEMYALVTAEGMPDEAVSVLAGAMDLLKHTLRGEGQVEFAQEQEQMEGGYPVRTLEMRSHKTTGNFFHIYWMTHRNGTLYRITAWATEGHAAEVREELRKIVDGFHLIDPKSSEPPSSKRTLALADI